MHENEAGVGGFGRWSRATNCQLASLLPSGFLPAEAPLPPDRREGKNKAGALERRFPPPSPSFGLKSLRHLKAALGCVERFEGHETDEQEYPAHTAPGMLDSGVQTFNPCIAALYYVTTSGDDTAKSASKRPPKVF